MRGFLALLLAAALLLVPTVPAKVETPRPFARDAPELVETLVSAAKEISGQNIFDCVQRITTDAPYHYRLMNTPTHQMFVQRHAKEFSQLSPRLKDQVVHFAEGGAGLGPGTLPGGGDNIIGVLPGKDLTRWIVLGGHYDTRELTLGGAAIDNTSGICTVREIARAMIALDLQPEATVVFGWWDGEEWGLYGARAFVKNHNATKELLGLTADTPVEILMGHSYDIVGINYPAYNTWVGYGQPTDLMEYAVLNLRVAPANEDNFTLCPSYACYARLKDRADFHEDILPKFVNHSALVKEVNYRLFELPPRYVNISDDRYGRSDHMPFIAAGIPGMRIQGSHDGQFPHYHQPTDTVPGAITLAGGQDRLVAGFNTAADAGGVTAIYIALTGTVGNYGLPDALVPGDVLPKDLEEPATVPGLGMLAVLLVALVGLLRRPDA